MTGPLGAILAALIRDEGPIGLDRFMALALSHPRHGYYMTRDPFGTAGDFVTAPEISQMFGELIGLWCTAVHASLGAPDPFLLVELGPGRGTLMADMLRAARAVPGFRAAATVNLVETSPVLRERQAATLAAAGVTPRWHDSLDTLPEGPALIVANEFFDALPVRHYVRSARGWHERLVGLDAQDGLALGLAAEPEAGMTLQAPVGSMLEIGFVAQTLMGQLAQRLVRQGGAALILDYGFATPRFGGTLQALRAHATVDPLASPGEADLTTHVDFAALGRAAQGAGATVHGPVSQGDFLQRLGIAARAAALARHSPDRAADIDAALQRLTGPAPGMGELFQAFCVTAPDLPIPPGFVVAASDTPSSRA